MEQGSAALFFKAVDLPLPFKTRGLAQMLALQYLRSREARGTSVVLKKSSSPVPQHGRPPLTHARPLMRIASLSDGPP